MATYDIVGFGGEYGNDENESFFTIGDLIELAKQNSECHFEFVGSKYSPDTELSSWRGSYNIPSIGYKRGSTLGADLEKGLSESLEEIHFGYKGGEYEYFSDEEFYVAQYGSSEEIKVCGYHSEENKIILLTKNDPY